MGLRSHRRNLVVWSQSAGLVGRYGAPPSTRIRPIRRWIRTGALLTVIRLAPLVRAGRIRRRLLLVLAGGVLTVVGVMLHGALSGAVSLPGLVLLASALVVPASPKADRMRRWELEHELGVYEHPAQRRLAIQAMALYDKRFSAHPVKLSAASSSPAVRTGPGAGGRGDSAAGRVGLVHGDLRSGACRSGRRPVVPVVLRQQRDSAPLTRD